MKTIGVSSKIVSPTSRATSRTTPASSVAITCSILSASSTATGWPFCTVSPTSTRSSTTMPWIGAATARVPSGPCRNAGGGVAAGADGPAAGCTFSTASGSSGSTFVPARSTSRSGVKYRTRSREASRRAAMLSSTYRVWISAGGQVRLLQQRLQERGVAAYALDAELRERPPGLADGALEIVRVDDELGEERVVELARRVAGIAAAVDPNAGTGRRIVGGDQPPGRTRRTVGVHGFEVDAGL